MNAKMAELKRSFERAGVTDVKTVLSSGNVVFSTPARSTTALARQAEAAMAQHLGRTFYTIVRPASVLRDVIEADPYAAFRLPASAKRVVTFLREPSKAKLSLPLVTDGLRILATNGREIFTAYVPSSASSRGRASRSLPMTTCGCRWALDRRRHAKPSHACATATHGANSSRRRRPLRGNAIAWLASISGRARTPRALSLGWPLT